MATSDALVYVRGYTSGATAGARSSSALLYAGARLVSGSYTPNVKNTSARNDAWRPRAGSPIGYATINGQRVPVMPDAAFMRWVDVLADRLGGATGVRLPDVVATVEAAQTSAAESSQRTQAVAQQAQANASVLAAAREVLINAGIPGSNQIPPAALDGGSYQVP